MLTHREPAWRRTRGASFAEGKRASFSTCIRVDLFIGPTVPNGGGKTAAVTDRDRGTVSIE